MKRGNVACNPCRLVEAPRAGQARKAVLSAQQGRAVLTAVAGRRNASRWSVGLACGLRQGEALGLAAGRQGLLLHPGTGAAAGPQRIDATLGRLASASLLTFSVDDATVAAHRLTMRVAVERQAQDGSLARLGAGIAELLSVVTPSLAQPWQNRAAARDAIQQIMALHEHLAPYLGEQDGAVTESLLRLRGWAIWCLNELGDSFAQAIEYGLGVVADREHVLGDTHPDTLTSRNNLASAYQDAGRQDEAGGLRNRAEPGP